MPLQTYIRSCRMYNSLLKPCLMSELSTRNEEMSAVVDGREKAAVHNRVANFQTLVWDLRLFVILQTFRPLFYIRLKPRLFCTSHHKTTTSKHPKIQEFWLYFAKSFCHLRQKRKKRPHPAGSSCVWAGQWSAVTRTVSTLRSFQTFLKHNVGNPAFGNSIVTATSAKLLSHLNPSCYQL